MDYDNPAFASSLCLFLLLANQHFPAVVAIFPQQIIKQAQHTT
jgi:hypothetical protein